MNRWAMLAGALLLIAAPALGLDLAWEQPDAGNVAGWRIYAGTESGGPWETLVATVPYSGEPSVEYQATVDAAAIPETRVYFVARAYSSAGVESAPSNEIFADMMPPAVPVNLRIVLNRGEE